ncbi:MAG: twin-arginine translocase TatA/TatE family subunit [Nitrososphaerales archaeon]
MWDDPVTIALIAGVAIFFFGASRIKSFSRALGEARRDFTNAWKGEDKTD